MCCLDFLGILKNKRWKKNKIKTQGNENKQLQQPLAATAAQQQEHLLKVIQFIVQELSYIPG